MKARWALASRMGPTGAAGGQYELILFVWDDLDVEGFCTTVGAAVHLDNDVFLSVQLYQAALA